LLFLGNNLEWVGQVVCKAIFAPWRCATLWVHFYLGRGSRFGALFSWKVCLNLISSPLFMFFICHSLWVYVFVGEIVTVNKCAHICMVWDLLSEICILWGGFSSPRTVCYLDQRWDTAVTLWEGVMSIPVISLKRQVQGVVLISESLVMGNLLTICRYIELVKKYALEISQPGLDPDRGLTWQMTKRRGDVEVHKYVSDVLMPWCHIQLCCWPSGWNFFISSKSTLRSFSFLCSSGLQ
jgi:hypothetical protein